MMLVGVGGRGGARRDAELVEDVAEMAIDRLLAELQLLRDRLVGLAGGDEAEHLDLAPREVAGLFRTRPALEIGEAGQIGGSAQLVEHDAGGLELERGAFPITECATGEPDEDADTGCQIRRANLPPGQKGEAKRTDRRLGITLGEEDRAAGMGDDGTEDADIEGRGDLLQFAGRPAGLLDVAGGEHDLDMGRQQADALQPLRRRAEDPPHGRGRRLGPALLSRLADPSLVWTNAVEPFMTQGAVKNFPLALALSADGSDIVDAIATNGASLLADLDQNRLRDPTLGSPHVTGFLPVLTRMRRGVFVVGGDRTSTGDPSGEIWWSAADRLTDNAWDLVDTAPYHVEHAVAATYSFATDRLYVLDVTSAGLARLTAIDPATSRASLLGTWTWTGAWAAQWLVVDRDGALLLASSSTAKKRYRIARIDLGDEGTVVTVRTGHKALALPPVVDAAGYTLVHLHGGDKLKVKRVDRLEAGHRHDDEDKGKKGKDCDDGDAESGLAALGGQL